MLCHQQSVVFSIGYELVHIVFLVLLLLTHYVESSPFFSDDLSKFDFIPKFKTHPMLYFTSSDIEDLKMKAGTTHRHIAQEIKDAVGYIQGHPKLMPPEDNEAFSSKWNEVYGNNLPVLAMHYILFPDEEDLQFIVTYMDRMTAYDSWYVTDMSTDEVPISHSLMGYLTAFDMIYQHIDSTRQRIYAEKIFEVSQLMYKASAKRSWGDMYLQNHQASNIVSLFMGSLVSELHSKNAVITQWKTYAVTMYERTMTILRNIEDGSLDEGVGYVGYTVRSLSQYVCLVKRHLRYDHSNHPWLRKHFEYMYLTIVPGLQRTVGIADSPQAWFYGPESQLVFLDAYALRDGRGNWLAQEIKKHKMQLMKSARPDPQRYTTLHTEFLFYDATIPPRPPPGYDEPQLHKFTDWGVVTYRSGSIMNNRSTFLSFKSGEMHGKYVNKIANSVRDRTLKGWASFNPGHEHADQNSITLWMDGQPFFSEGLYGSKLPYLDNVLMFLDGNLKARDQYTPCTYPWIGQLGNCKKWLTWKGKEEGRSHGKILVSAEKDGMVLVAGDAAGSYTSALGLQHSYRSILLLGKDLGLVFDHIVLQRTSRVSHVAAFFNNFMHSFKATRHRASKLSGFTLDGKSGYQALWCNVHGDSPRANITVNRYKSSGKEIGVSNANVTYEVHNKTSSVAFLFAGPSVHVLEFGITKSHTSRQAYIHVRTKESAFRVVFALNQREPQDKLYASVYDITSKKSVHFHEKSTPTAMAERVHTHENFHLFQEHIHSMVDAEDRKYLLLFGAVGIVISMWLVWGKSIISNPLHKKLCVVGFVAAIFIFVAIL